MLPDNSDRYITPNDSSVVLAVVVGMEFLMRLVVHLAFGGVDEPLEATACLVEFDDVRQQLALLIEIVQARLRYTNQTVLIWHGVLQVRGEGRQPSSLRMYSIGPHVKRSKSLLRISQDVEHEAHAESHVRRR